MAISDLTKEEQELLKVCDDYVENKISIERHTGDMKRAKDIFDWAVRGMSKKKVKKIISKARRSL